MHTVTAGTQKVGGKRARVSPKTFTFADSGSGNGKTEFEFVSSSIDLAADGRYQTVAEMDVEDGVGIMFGRGRSRNPLQAQGFAGIRFADDNTPTNVAEGDYRIAVRTSTGRRLFNLHEGTLATEDLYDESDTKKDRKDREPMPQAGAEFETEPRIITIDVDASSAVTVAEPSTSSYSDLELDGWLAEALE